MALTVSNNTLQHLRSALASPGAAKELITILQNLPSDEEQVALTAKVAEINARAHGQPASVTITNAAGTTNVCNVTFQVKDGTGTNLTGPTNLVIMLSDAATGAGLTATAPVTSAGAGSAGTDLSVLVTKKAILVQTDATGKYILAINDSGKTLYYPTATIGGEKVSVGAQLTAGSYG